MIIKERTSFRNAAKILRDRGALEACHALVTDFDGQLKDKSKRLHELGFKGEVQIEIKGLRNPRFDAFHQDWKIGVELEKREQMNVRSHLLFTEIAYLKEMIEVAVYILPIRDKGKNQGTKANYGRTLNELSDNTEIFSIEYFQLTVPIYLLGYDQK